jgi:hypothetical protein
MSDLCAPIYVVMGSDEDLTFWCFVEVMNRMVCIVFLPPVMYTDTMSTAEAEFLARSKRNEETTTDLTATHRYHGPRIVSPSRCAHSSDLAIVCVIDLHPFQSTQRVSIFSSVSGMLWMSCLDEKIESTDHFQLGAYCIQARVSVRRYPKTMGSLVDRLL